MDAFSFNACCAVHRDTGIGRCLAEAKSDLVNVLSRLEAHWVVLEAELVEINKDITYCEQCVKKYGYVQLPTWWCHCGACPERFAPGSEYFTYPLQHLKVKLAIKHIPSCSPIKHAMLLPAGSLQG
eukprot:2961990-Rhodomonas_salina.1